MTATAEIIEPADARWSEVLDSTRHDFHHLPAYCELAAWEAGARAAAFHAECDGATILLPVLLSEVPGGTLQDALSPYGYPAPLFRAPPDAPAGAFTRCIEAIGEHARSAGIVAAFVRMHPLLDADDASLRSAGDLMDHGSTVTVNLRHPWASVEKGIRSGMRYDIRKLVASGYRVSHNDWRRYRPFGAIYRETMTRVGADERYLFTDEYLARLRLALGDRLHLFVAEDGEGETAAAGLFTRCCGIVQYHLSGSDSRHLSRAPTKLLVHEALRWAHEDGAHVAHLGGGVGSSEDALFRFKAGFSKDRAHFRTWRAVFDAPAYDGLMASWRARTGATEPGSFFPGYRAPVPATA
jgi:hypothetical protein